MYCTITKTIKTYITKRKYLEYTGKIMAMITVPKALILKQPVSLSVYGTVNSPRSFLSHYQDVSRRFLFEMWSQLTHFTWNCLVCQNYITTRGHLACYIASQTWLNWNHFLLDRPPNLINQNGEFQTIVSLLAWDASWYLWSRNW